MVSGSREHEVWQSVAAMLGKEWKRLLNDAFAGWREATRELKQQRVVDELCREMVLGRAKSTLMGLIAMQDAGAAAAPTPATAATPATTASYKAWARARPATLRTNSATGAIALRLQSPLVNASTTCPGDPAARIPREAMGGSPASPAGVRPQMPAVHTATSTCRPKPTATARRLHWYLLLSCRRAVGMRTA